MKIYDISRLPNMILLGFDGENNWRHQSFDVSPLLQNHPNGTITLWLLPDGETQAFPVALERDGNTVVWTPLSEEMTARTGALQIVCTDGTDVGKSRVALFRVDSSILPGADHPAAVPSWATQTIERAEDAAERAEEAAESIDIEALEARIAQAVEEYIAEHPPEVVETDPTVPAWAKQPDKPTYTAAEVGALPDTYTPPVQSVNGKTGAVALGASDVGALPDDTVIPSAVTEQTVSGWGFTKNTGDYTKPSGGIPKSDLAQAVQTSLGKADTALQTHQSLAAYRTASAQDTIDAGKANSAELATVAFSGDYNDLLNRPDDGYIFADEIPTDADHSAKYVLPDGYIYVYGEHTYHRTHNANTGLVNIKPDVNANYQSLSAQSGVLTSDLIPFSPDWVPSSADRANSTIKVSGIEKLVPAYNNSAIIVYLYYADGSWMGAARTSQISSLGAPALGSEVSVPVEWYLKDSGSAGVVGGWANVGYVRVLIGVSTSGSITADDVANVVINVPYYDADITATEWYNTGERYVADPQVAQNTEDIANLKTRMSDAEDDVSAVSDSLENGSFSNVSTGQVLYAVGDSITYGYGVGGNSGSWVRHVIDRNGYDAANSRNLGESGLGFCTASTSNHTVQDIVGGTDFGGADVVTVALGINDWKNYNVFLTDVWSGMEYVFGKIRSDNPYCKIYFIVPFNVSIGTSAYATFYGLGYAGDNNPLRPYAHTLLEFIGMLKERFALSPLNAYNVQIIDLTEGVAINRQNITTALIDNLHPTAETHIELGKEIAPILRFNNHYGQTAAQVQSAIGAIQAWQGGSY